MMRSKLLPRHHWIGSSDSCYRPFQFLDMTVNKISKGNSHQNMKSMFEHRQLARWIFFRRRFCNRFLGLFCGGDWMPGRCSYWTRLMTHAPLTPVNDWRASISEMLDLIFPTSIVLNLSHSILVPDPLSLTRHCRLSWLGIILAYLDTFPDREKILVSADNCPVWGKLREWLLINWEMILSSIYIESVLHLPL